MVKINYEVVEMMVFFWEQVADRAKVQDAYFIEMAEKPELKVIYSEEFSKDSFRKVLSAINNRELMSSPTKAESRFWNVNMWILEDLDNMRNMMNKVKKLNLDDIKEGKDINLFFIPAHLEECYVEGANLYINFYKIMVDYMDPSKAKINGMNFEEYIREKLTSM